MAYGDIRFKKCMNCGAEKIESEFPITKNNLFYKDGTAPICHDCIQKTLVAEEFNWEAVDKVCQIIDIPFVPNEFERLREIHGPKVFQFYSKVFQDSQFEGLNWKDYYNRFFELRKAKLIEKELPHLKEERLDRLKRDWGMNYDSEALDYLENLFAGMLATQSINGALQMDQARKLCKISYEMDQKIIAGEDFDKLTSSYDKIVKMAQFTPKNTKNENDLDSFGEAVAWLERKGWVNGFYDGANRDVVDETLSNLKHFNQKLYTGESSMGDQIESRIASLQSAANLSIVSSDNKNQEEMDIMGGHESTFGLEEIGEDIEDYDLGAYNEIFGEEG